MSDHDVLWPPPLSQIDYKILQQQNKQLRANKRLSVPLPCLFWLGLATAEATEPFPAVPSCSVGAAQRPPRSQSFGPTSTEHRLHFASALLYRLSGLGQRSSWHGSKQKGQSFREQTGPSYAPGYAPEPSAVSKMSFKHSQVFLPSRSPLRKRKPNPQWGKNQSTYPKLSNTQGGEGKENMFSSTFSQL